jgi:hypothetical protein
MPVRELEKKDETGVTIRAKSRPVRKGVIMVSKRLGFDVLFDDIGEYYLPYHNMHLFEVIKEA